MIIENVKKVLSSVILATYIVVYTAPAGFCITNVAKMPLTEQKPVLRGSSNSYSLRLEGDVAISKKNPKISLSLRDSDVKQVLRMFADKAGMNIIFHSSVDVKDDGSDDGSDDTNSNTAVTTTNTTNTSSSVNEQSGSDSGNQTDDSEETTKKTSARTITLDLVNVPINDAFKMVMQVTGLTYYIDSNTIIVASAKAAKKLNLSKQELMTIPVKYVDATVLAKFLNKNVFSINKPGLSNANIAITNPRMNEILIFGTKNDYYMAKKIVAQFDQKPLEQTFVVNHTTPKEMANLVCKVLLNANGSSSSTSSGSGSDSSDSSSDSSDSSGSDSSSGSQTGGAASSSSSSSDSGSDSTIALGKGIVACQVKKQYNAGELSSLDSTSLSVTYFPQRGAVTIVGGSSQQMQLIKEFIAQNDKKQPQAYLEVSLIELNENGSKEFNNTWNVYTGFFSGYFNGTTATNSTYPTFFAGDSVTSGTTTINKYTGTPTITYIMSYLISNTKGRVLANPRIIITNGQKSTIDLSSDYVKKVTSEVMVSNGTTGATQKTYEIGEDEGIKVDITPFISPDGYVTLNIKPEYSTVKQQVPAVDANGKATGDIAATLLQRRNLNLKNVRIKDGETLIIGGMIKEDEQKTVSKIPVLGDLPGIGIFFRNSKTKREKSELVIMLTPKIIKESEDIVNKPDATL